ncbi:MAG: hypothetical protein J6X51_06485 [Bacteroidales bacterium]|jgi:hypothetical protein|nr:hypothetical protein [Bacteroidales bacterium]
MGGFKKSVFVLAVLLMCGGYVRAQKDTVHIGEIHSSVPITGKVADLQYVFGGKGEWCYGTFNREIEYYPWNIHDTAVYVYRVNSIYDKKTGTSYTSDKDGNIRLSYLDFKLARKLARGCFLSLGDVGLYLSYNTTLDEFIKAFNITDTIEFGPALMAPWNYYGKARPRRWRHRQFTNLWFWTDEGRRTHITFSFDHKRRLRCVELDYFNADKVEVRPLR